MAASPDSVCFHAACLYRGLDEKRTGGSITGAFPIGQGSFRAAGAWIGLARRLRSRSARIVVPRTENPMPISRALLVGAVLVGAVPAVVMSSATVLGTRVTADSAVVRNVRSILGSGSLETPLTAGQNPERLAGPCLHLPSLGRTVGVSFVWGDKGVRTYLDFGHLF